MVWFNWKFRWKVLIWLSAFQSLKQQCQDYATALLDHTRSSSELEVILNYDPNGPAYHVSNEYLLFYSVHICQICDTFNITSTDWSYIILITWLA